MLKSSAQTLAASVVEREYKDGWDGRQREPTLVRDAGPRTRVCFIGLNNLSVLAPDLDPRTAAGEPVQQSLLALAFARRGYTVSTIAAYDNAPGTLVRDDVSVFRAYEPRAGLPVVRFVHPRFTGLWRAMKRADADVYYVSCAGAILGQVALFCQRHGKRFVFRVASDADCSPDTLLIEYWRDKRLYEFGLRRASAILVQSAQQQQMLRENYGLDSIIAGMLVEHSDLDLPFEARDMDALWVSNIRPLKRPDLLCDLAAALPHLSIHMAGGRVSSEPACYEEVHARALALSNLTFHGAVPFRDISGLYARARVFVNTSDIEGFPNTYLQAWASGTPVVAYFDPDDVIEREGLGVAVATPQEMHDAVASLARDPQAWAAASARCRAYVERHFAERRVLEPYEQVLGTQDPSARPSR